MLLHHLVGSALEKTSPDMTPGRDHVASFDAEQVEDIDENVKLFAAIGTKTKPRKWMKKHDLKLVTAISSSSRSLFTMTVVRRFI